MKYGAKNINDIYTSRIKEKMPIYDAGRVLNASPGDLVICYSYTGLKGFIIKKSQSRRPGRTDVYLVKFQNKAAKDIDERFLMLIEEDE